MFAPRRATALLALLAASPVAHRFRLDPRTGILRNRSVVNNDRELVGGGDDDLPQFALLLEASPGESWLSLHVTQDDAVAHAAGAEAGGWSGEFILDLDAGEGHALSARMVRAGLAFALADAPDAA